MAEAAVASLAQAARSCSESARAAKANKQRCVRLAQRAETVAAAVGRTPAAQSPPAMARIQAVVDECRTLVAELAGDTFLETLVARRHEADPFVRLNRALQREAGTLGLELNMQALFNAKDDRDDAAKDAQELAQHQGALVEALRAAVQPRRSLACDMGDYETRLESSLRFMAVELLRTAEEREHERDEALGCSLIPFAELEMGELLGSGGFGDVYAAKWHSERVAVKMIKVSATRAQRGELKRELKQMAGLRQGNIAQVVGACIEPDNCCLVMTQYARGSLYAVVNDRSIELPWPRRECMALDIARGMAYLHDAARMVHRDLKSPNVLVDERWTCVVADFGLARMRQETASKTRHVASTLQWSAPELLDMKRVTDYRPSDVYSYGVILWELAEREPPYGGRDPSATSVAVCAGRRPEISNGCPVAFKTWIERCWAQEAATRPAFRDIVAIMEQDWKGTMDKEQADSGASGPPKTQPPTVEHVRSSNGSWARESVPFGPISAADRQRYDDVFVQAGAVRGWLSTQDAYNVFLKSGLPQEDLAWIWALADMDGSGRFDSTSFAIAMHLIYARRDGTPVPNVLPAVVRDSAIATSVKSGAMQIRGANEDVFGGSSSGASGAASDAWPVSVQDTVRYDQLFREIDTNRDGRVAGPDVVPLFFKSGLDRATLDHIWNLCDIGHKSYLYSGEFALAMHLIRAKLSGVEPPATLSAASAPPTAFNSTFSKPVAANKKAPELQRDMKEIRAQPDNKTCFECGQKGTTYVDLDTCAFVCTSCSGLLRSFNHEVKSLTIATFKPDEIERLRDGGNDAARSVWLGRLRPGEYALPDPGDVERIREFMRIKYDQRRWYLSAGKAAWM